MRVKAKRQIVLRPVHPNAGLEAAFRKKLETLIDQMQASIERYLLAAYRAHPPEMAQDESPAATMKKVMQKLKARWQSRFDEAAPRLAKYFSQAMQDRSDRQLRQILRDGGFAVSFTMSRAANDVMRATMAEQVGLIRNMSQKHLHEIEGLVMRSVQEGRDLAPLYSDLRARYGMTRRRAALIAKDQNNKATAMMNRVRQTELGIDEAIWQHSHAGKEPRPTHVANSGKRYKVAEGWLDPAIGKRIWPGTEINCRCQSRSVIPGFV